MCSELLKSVIRVSKIFSEIEEARPRCSSGIEALCLLNNGIIKAKSLIQYCSESSVLYLVCTFLWFNWLHCKTFSSSSSIWGISFPNNCYLFLSLHEKIHIKKTWNEINQKAKRTKEKIQILIKVVQRYNVCFCTSAAHRILILYLPTPSVFDPVVTLAFTINHCIHDF